MRSLLSNECNGMSRHSINIFSHQTSVNLISQILNFKNACISAALNLFHYSPPKECKKTFQRTNICTHTSVLYVNSNILLKALKFVLFRRSLKVTVHFSQTILINPPFSHCLFFEARTPCGGMAGRERQ